MLAATRSLSARPVASVVSRRSVVVVRAAAGEKPAAKTTVGKAALVEAIAKEAELTKEQATKAFDALIGSIEDALIAGERVTIVGFGSFERKDRAERNGRNPSTGEAMVIPAQKTATFKVSPALKDTINGKVPEPKPKAAAPAPAKPRPAPTKPASPPAAKKAAPPKPAPKK
ncbi:hypothetical protein GPECTOR_44g31 [Gonium pectorale]|uniref:Uncharacterized protein n=1 Tax=Gonium pectorale TaxID=33097 RepID=A0A150G9B4_GONPE|nr:hypothetical protein GPECTOR_44g31 [Gonium pectorale]|eukprot:KXZ46353.1 hypothetical protein GPECTOR_44g31 [Gonium pectorale]